MGSKLPVAEYVPGMQLWPAIGVVQLVDPDAEAKPDEHG